MNTPSATLNSKPAAPFVKPMAVGVVLLNLLIVAASVLSLYESRIRHDERAAATTRNLARVLEQYVNAVIDKAVGDEARARPVDRTIDAPALYTMFASIDVGAHGSITLHDARFGVVARHPQAPAADGAASAELLRLMRAGTAGTFIDRAVSDGSERVLSYRKIADHPFAIVVGLARDDYLAPWRGEVVERIAYAGLFAVITFSWVWLVHRGWVRKALAARLERQVQARTAQLRALAMELTMVEERERHAIAQDLHDDLGQTLAIAKLKLSALDAPRVTPVCPHHAELMGQVKEVEGMIDRSNRSVRSLSRQLSPPVLHQLGLVPALEWLADEMNESCRLKVRVHDDGEPKPLDPASASMLFRAVRELLINVHKHAGTDRADVAASMHAGSLLISVTDSGAGFDVGKKIAPTAAGGFGLFSVSERIGHFGGEMQIDSGRGDGTVVVLILPLTTRATEGSEQHDTAGAD